MERLRGVIQPYAWGSRTAIPEFLGVDATGETQAEMWLGEHPLAPSTVDGEPLDKLVAQDPVSMVGRASVEAFGPRLPFLLKIIAAAQPLSLQAHPSREQAEAGYAREQAAGVVDLDARQILRVARNVSDEQACLLWLQHQGSALIRPSANAG